MARSLYQEPHEYPSDNGQPNQGAHPERLPTDFGGSTPAHPDWQPDPLDKSNDPKNKNKLIAVVAATGVGAIAVAGAALFGVKNEVHELGNKLAGADAANSAPELPGQSSPEHKTTIDINVATPDQFYSDANFTDEQRVDWAWNRISQPSHEVGYEGMTLLQAAHKQLADMYNKPGNYQYIKDLVEPSESMSGDQILTLSSTISHLAATADLSPTDRAKVIAADSDNSSPNLQRAINAAVNRDTYNSDGVSDVITDASTNKKVESPVFRHYKPENGYDPKGVPSKIMTTMQDSVQPARYDQVIVQFVHNKPIIVDTYSPTNKAKYILSPEDIPANS